MVRPQNEEGAVAVPFVTYGYPAGTVPALVRLDLDEAARETQPKRYFEAAYHHRHNVRSGSSCLRLNPVKKSIQFLDRVDGTRRFVLIPLDDRRGWADW